MGSSLLVMMPMMAMAIFVYFKNITVKGGHYLIEVIHKLNSSLFVHGYSSWVRDIPFNVSVVSFDSKTILCNFDNGFGAWYKGNETQNTVLRWKRIKGR